MTKELWLNLPVKDTKKSREFFEKLGFSFNERFSPGAEMAGLQIGKNVVMLCQENTFENFAQVKAADVKQAAEVLISIDAESRAEVDDLATQVEKAGGNVFAKPAEIQGWMYGCAFTDLDGHRWNALYMDMSKMK